VRFCNARPRVDRRAGLRCERVATLIQRRLREPSDASASGNAAVLRRYLDDRVVFINETGEIATEKDIVESAAPPERGTTQRLVQTDFSIRVHGTVAVTSFTDVSTAVIAGRTVRSSFRSTEVWLRESGGWKMISSQTIALERDPPAVVLPAALLDEYVGTYRAGPGFDLTIARAGSGIAGSLNGAPAVAYRAELRDVFSGRPNRACEKFSSETLGARSYAS
jgi:ketosteroid isomerase-like protein